MNRILPSAVAILALLQLTPAWSATYNYATTVVESDDLPPVFNLPSLGTDGTISITFDAAALDADPAAPEFGMPFPELPGVTVEYSSAGLSSSLTEPSAFAFGGGVRFSNSDFSNIVVSVPGTNCSSIGCTLAGSFYFAGPAGTATPSNYADVEAILANPSTSAAFSFNGTILSGEFVSFRAESTMAPVPLPASALLLVGALGGIGGLSWRRKRKAAAT